MYSIAIVDDEKEQTQDIQKHIDRFFSENGGSASVKIFFDGKELLEKYTGEFDLVFLDIDMPEINGLSAAHKIREKDSSTAIIFVTRMARYAIKGYEVGALDFIVKPVDYYSFALKMKRAVTYVDKNAKSKITLRLQDSVVCLDAGDITYVETFNHNLIYHVAGGGQSYKVWGSLKTATQQLEKTGLFAACNRCYLVNLRHVKSVSGNAALVDNEQLIISRYKRKEFIERLAEYFGGG